MSAQQDLERHLASCPTCREAANEHAACAEGRRLNELAVLEGIASHHDAKGEPHPPELQAALRSPQPRLLANQSVYRLPPVPIIPVAAQVIEGTDHSVWQGSGGDFNALKAGGYYFAIVKSSEGYGYVDPTFAGNLRKLKASGLQAGVYHFSRPDLGSSPAAEANFFVDTVVSVAGSPEGIIFEHDAESNGGSEAWCRDFQSALQARLNGYGGGFYSYLNWLQSRGIGAGSSLNESHLWLAWPESNGALPHPPPWPFVSIQQYTARPVPGWSGSVDVNRFFGTPQQLASLAVGGGGGFLMALNDQQQAQVLADGEYARAYIDQNLDPILRHLMAQLDNVIGWKDQNGDPLLRDLQQRLADLATKIGQLGSGTGGVIQLDPATKAEVDAMKATVEELHGHFDTVFK